VAPTERAVWLIAVMNGRRVVPSLPRPRSAPGFVIDLRVGSDDPNGALLWQPRLVRSVEYAVYDSDFERRTVMPQAFNGVIFVDGVGPLRMLAR
jgi:hypothetical protein